MTIAFAKHITSALDAMDACMMIVEPPLNTPLWDCWAGIQDELATYRAMSLDEQMLIPYDDDQPAEIELTGQGVETAAAYAKAVATTGGDLKLVFSRMSERSKGRSL
jgi:hypothetical protein